MSEACAHCGGDTRLCTTLCCQGECGEEDCRYVWAAYGWTTCSGSCGTITSTRRPGEREQKLRTR